MRTRLSPIETAEREIGFDVAAGWAGLYEGSARVRGNKISCPFCLDGGGRSPSFRVYPDHGYCFAGCGYFSTVRLLAEFWQLPREVAAEQGLKKIGWRPPTVDNLWSEAVEEPEPDRTALEFALRSYCESVSEDWATDKYKDPVALKLAQCLSLLPLVKTQAECVEWLSRCKEAMSGVIGGSSE
jgi:hypothetical protein